MTKILYILLILGAFFMGCGGEDHYHYYNDDDDNNNSTTSGTSTGTSSTGTSGTSSGGNELNIPYYKQQTEVWCWLATTQMIAAYYNKYYEQCQLVSYAMNYSCCADVYPCVRPAGNIDNMTMLMQYIGLHGTQYNRSLSEQEIINAIDNNHPIIAGSINWYAGSGHVVVISGYQRTPYGIQYKILDPFTYVSYKDYYSIIRNQSGDWSVSWVFN